MIPVAGGAHRWVSSDLDRTFAPTAGPRPPVWLDDDTLLATAEDRGDTHLYRIAVDGGAAGAADRTARSACSRSTPPAAASPWPRRRVEHPAEIVTLDGPGDQRDPLAARVGEVRRADDRRQRRDRRLDHAPGRVRAAPQVPRAAQRPRRPVHPVRRDVLRRGPDAGGGRLRRRHVQPARRQRARHGVGAGDQRAEAPEGRRAPAGARVDVDDVLAVLDARARPLRVLRPRSGRHARRQLRRLHGHAARRPPRRPLPGHLLASGRSTTCSPRSGAATSAPRSSVDPRHRPHRGPRRVRCGCRRSATSATSTSRC